MRKFLDLPKSGIDSISYDAEFQQNDAKFTEMVVGLLNGKLILGRYRLENNRMDLNAFNNPRKQIDGPMLPYCWMKLSRRQVRHGECLKRRTASFTNGGRIRKGHGVCLRMSNG